MKTVSLKDTFNNVVKMYETARPTYPKQLLEDVMEFSGKRVFDRALEVGAGTGQATDLFIKAVKHLDIVEVGDKQVEYLKEKYKDCNVCIYKSYFESFDIDRRYDLIFSATAFHWVDANIGYPKAWNLLNARGTLAVFWHMSSVTQHNTGIFVELDNIKKKFLPKVSLGFDEAGIESVRQKRIAQIQSGNCFGIPEIREYQWVDKYDADRYSLLLESYSSTQTLDEKERTLYLDEVKKYINENGGVVEMPQHVMLYMVSKA